MRRAQAMVLALLVVRVMVGAALAATLCPFWIDV